MLKKPLMLIAAVAVSMSAFVPQALGATGESVILVSSDQRAVKAVKRQIAFFSGTRKENFTEYLNRSGRYIGLMKEILRGHGIPEDVVFLALIESGFNPHARSRSRAVGPWQFIKATGKRYGLRIDWWVDERKDPVKSTHAAARYLKDLYARFGSWSLAMAAYNAGEGKIYRALKRVRKKDYWTIRRTRYIKSETKHYVPKFIAARIIAADPETFGFTDIQYHDVFEFDEVKISEPLDIDLVARSAGVEPEEILELNPELKRWMTPPSVVQYVLRIPKGTMGRFWANLSSVPEDEKFSIMVYHVKKGDTLSEIATRARVPLGSILSLNSLSKRKLIRIGQVIYIPTKGTVKLNRKKLIKLKDRLRKLKAVSS